MCIRDRYDEVCVTFAAQFQHGIQWSQLRDAALFQAADDDARRIATFTIDPKDAKDFDDALSARKLDNGNWEVGVHIADVTYYVKPESLIDREAFSRATSVYLVDRTIAMLPRSEERRVGKECRL